RSRRKAVAAGPTQHFIDGDLVGPGRIEAEDLGAQRGSDLRIAVSIAQFFADLEAAEGLALILGRTVPDGIRSPEHVVLAPVLEELAKRVSGGVRVAHQVAPGAAELRIDIAVGPEVILHHGLDERIDALVAIGPEFALRLARYEARVIDEKVHVRKAPRHHANVIAEGMFIGLRPEGQTLVNADVLDA